MEIYTDGASSGNPGPAGIGIVIYDRGKPVKEISKYIGNTTNNVAEQTAVLYAVEFLAKNGIKKATIYTDSELLVKQMNGEYKTKNKRLREIQEKIRSYGVELRFVHIPREENKKADFLAKRGIRDHREKT